MLIFSIILIIIAMVLFGLAYSRIFKIHKLNDNIDKENQEKEKFKKELEKQIVELKNTINFYKDSEQQSQKGFENYCKNLDLYYEIKEHEFDTQVSSLSKELEQKKKDNRNEAFSAFLGYMNTLEKNYIQAEKDFDNKITILKEKYNIEEEEFNNKIIILQDNYNIEEEKLNKIKATYAAVKEAQLREEEIMLKADFYSLHLTQLELDTIALIEELKPRLPEPRTLCMLIWSTFYQKQMTALCNNVLGTGTVCGIYKITNKRTGQCYIGQATNCADRWKQHVKCGLGIDTPVQNKLYKAMQRDGVVNFTFELLEACPKEQLNEKERFYINLYQAYEYGYNSTTGNK